MAPRTPMILRIGGEILDVDMTKAQVLSQSFLLRQQNPDPARGPNVVKKEALEQTC